MNLRKNLSKLPKEAFCNENLYFKEIQSDDDLAWAVGELQLPPDQQEMVSPVGFLLGRAYLFPEDNIPYLICKQDDDHPIGFILLRLSHKTDNPNSWSCYVEHEPRTTWSYFIVPEHQGQGYGKSAAKLSMDLLLKAAPDYPIMLSTEQHNARAHKLYTEIGFQKADELDGDDFVFLYGGT